MLYDRRVRYLDYREHGERIRGAGFVKLEVRNGCLRMELSVTGLHPTDVFERDILLQGEKDESVLGKIMISAGRGEFRQSYDDLDHMGKSGIRYSQTTGIRIPLGAGREISCSWEQRSDKAEGIKEERGAVREERADRREKAGKTAHRAAAGEAGGTGGAERTNRGAGFGMGEWPEGKNREDGPTGQKKMGEGAPADGAGRRGGAERTNRAAGSDREEGKGGNGEVRIAGQERIGAGGRTNEGAVPDKTDEGSAKDSASTAADARRAYQGEGAGESGQVSPWERRDRGERGARRRQESAAEEEASGSVKESRNGRRASQGEENPAQLLEDKWQQLYAIYPHIHPFGDEREYISIRPADFVVFPSESYKAANNSFLLHGYYNYKHLILTRVENKGEFRYYIGVPGNYYEREKQVAIMFGFESFECAEEPAQAGDFGYYMMRTEL